MKLLKFIIIFCLCILLTGNFVWGIEAPTPPNEPIELTQENINNYNAQVDIYNQQVNEYNQVQQEQYNQELTEYNNSLIHNQQEDEKVKQIEQANLEETNRVNEINQQKEEEALIKQEEAIQHNELEDQKVLENQQALAEQSKIEQYIEIFKERGIDTTTSSAADLPTDWTPTTEIDNTKTIKVEEAEELSDETYNVMNMHFYLNENASDVLNDDVTFDENDNPIFSDNLTNNFVLAEWETVEVNKNDVVTTISESEPMGYRSAAFYRYMDGYTNGYWVPNYSIFMSTAVYSDSIWYKGAAQEFSYVDGTTDKQPIKNALSLYTYSFQRTGEEPEKVEEYVPDYWDTNIPVEYEEPNYQEYTPNYITENNPETPTYLNTLDHLTYTPVEEETISVIEPTSEEETTAIVEPQIPTEEETTQIKEETTPVIEQQTIIESETIFVEEKEEEIIIPNIIFIPQNIISQTIIKPNIPYEESVPDIPIEMEPEELPIIENDITESIQNNDIEFVEPIINPIPIVNNTIEIEEYDTPLGSVNFYDYRGIPILYSPRESGIYIGSNKGNIPINGYLLKGEE